MLVSTPQASCHQAAGMWSGDPQWRLDEGGWNGSRGLTVTQQTRSKLQPAKSSVAKKSVKKNETRPTFSPLEINSLFCVYGVARGGRMWKTNSDLWHVHVLSFRAGCVNTCKIFWNALVVLWWEAVCAVLSSDVGALWCSVQALYRSWWKLYSTVTSMASVAHCGFDLFLWPKNRVCWCSKKPW